MFETIRHKNLTTKIKILRIKARIPEAKLV